MPLFCQHRHIVAGDLYVVSDREQQQREKNNRDDLRSLDGFTIDNVVDVDIRRFHHASTFNRRLGGVNGLSGEIPTPVTVQRDKFSRWLSTILYGHKIRYRGGIPSLR